MPFSRFVKVFLHFNLADSGCHNTSFTKLIISLIQCNVFCGFDLACCCKLILQSEMASHIRWLHLQAPILLQHLAD